MKEFFEKVRAHFGPLSASQVRGLNALLVASEGLPLTHRAYILATAWHETGPTGSALHMTPRREIWGPTDAQRRYEGRTDLGNTKPGDGKRYMGRGYVQITGRANYAKASKIVGADLVAEPDLALDDAIAAKIIVDGMVNGWFTQKYKMSNFDNYKGMRRVVNGTDKAELIAGYADVFEDALKAVPAAQPSPAPPSGAAGTTAPGDTSPLPLPPSPVPPSPVPPDKFIAGVLLGGLAALVAALIYWVTKGG